MATGYERYSTHPVWETLKLKREALFTARYDDANLEQWREDLIDWLDEASKTKAARQPALYLSALDRLSSALNALALDTGSFNHAVTYRGQNGYPIFELEQALRAMPLPPPRDLKASYLAQLDAEVDARNQMLGELEVHVKRTEDALQERLAQLNYINEQVEILRTEITSERAAIKAVSETAASEMNEAWVDTLATWHKDRRKADTAHDAEALEQIATLAATTNAGEALAEHAAGDLSATDWYGRAKRERKAAQWIRFAAWAAFVLAGAVGSFIVVEAIGKNFEISVGGGILRASIAVVIGAFGALLLREAGRHFREADTAEDVALSLKALAPFYANSADGIKLAARVELGDAVLVKNVLSRFSHRDASKHASEVKTTELPSLVKEAAEALKIAGHAG